MIDVCTFNREQHIGETADVCALERIHRLLHADGVENHLPNTTMGGLTADGRISQLSLASRSRGQFPDPPGHGRGVLACAYPIIVHRVGTVDRQARRLVSCKLLE